MAVPVAKLLLTAGDDSRFFIALSAGGLVLGVDRGLFTPDVLAGLFGDY